MAVTVWCNPHLAKSYSWPLLSLGASRCLARLA